MNFSVTGEPAPSQLDQKRKQLMQSLLSGGPGQQRLLGVNGKAIGAGRGLSRGYTANDSPNAAVPGLTFNPFLAQIQRGVSGLAAPTQGVRQQVSDLTGGAAPQLPFGTPGQVAPQPGAGPVSDPGPQGSAPAGGGPTWANPLTLAQAMAAAGVAHLGEASGGSIGLFGNDPTQPTGPPPSSLTYPGIQYIRGRGGLQ